MEPLLADALQAHGGLENWRRVTGLTARMALGGPFWAGRGWPGICDAVTVEVDTPRERIVFAPFTAPDRRSVLEVAPDHPDQIAIETRSGERVEQRADPRASYPLFTPTTPWDPLQVIVLSADDFDADTAERYGWINRALPDAELDAYVDRLARRMACFDATALATAKEIIVQRAAPPGEANLRQSFDAILQLASSDAARQTNARLRAKAGGSLARAELDLPRLYGQQEP